LHSQQEEKKTAIETKSYINPRKKEPKKKQSRERGGGKSEDVKGGK